MPTLSYEEWEHQQIALRETMVEVLARGIDFLQRVRTVEAAISSKPDENSPEFPRGFRGQSMAKDFRANYVYHLRCQAVWEDLRAALHRIGNSIDFVRLDAPAPEQVTSVLLDKQIILDEFVATCSEAMLEAPGQASTEELRALLESTNSRIADLEAEQRRLPEAPYAPNHWDLNADSWHHDCLHGWPYQDRANPEELEEAETT